MKVKFVAYFYVSTEFLTWLTDDGYSHHLSIGLFQTVFYEPKAEYVSACINERTPKLPAFWPPFIEFVLNDVNLYRIDEVEFLNEL